MEPRIEWRPGMSLTEYAARWVDMMPHLEALRRYASEAETVLEFGVRGGVSTWAVLKGLPEDGELYAIDNDPDVLEMLPPWVRDDGRLSLVIGNDLTEDLPESADLVMIDSGHEYEQTLAELARVTTLLEPERILLHDYLYDETPGVRQAVDEFTSRRVWRLVTVHPSHWGLAVLER